LKVLAVLDRSKEAAMNVAEYLTSKKVDFKVLPHHETHDAQRLAQSLRIPGQLIAKTVLLRANGGYTFVVAVLPATKNIDFARASAALGGSKLHLATETEVASHFPDCECGVLPPFGSQYAMKTLVDESLAKDIEIVFEGNTHHEAIRMKFDDFCRVENPLIVNLTH
jgi:Ala-tRNA(Pro) deacylase